MQEYQIGTLMKDSMDCIEKAVKEINSLGENKRENVTHFINAAHNMGKYHGYMDILEKLDMDQFIKLHEWCKNDCDKVLQGMEKLYQMIKEC